MTDLRLDADPSAADHTTAIQALLDRLKADGGGRLVIPPGRWTCGTIHLPPCTDLHLAPGAVLAATPDPARYTEATIAGEYGGNAGGFLISAVDADQVSISGTGTIDGCGREYMDGWWVEDGPYIRAPKDWRPRGIGLFSCTGVRIRDITIRDAAQWTMHLTGCEDVVIDGITIKNGLDVPNCDGIDPDHCRNVRISNCHIEAGDDGIVLKNTKDYRHLGASENIVIDNCTIVSTSAAIKIGTESAGPFRNVIVRGCTLTGSHRGIAVQLRDDGDVEDLLFSDCLIETRLFHTKWWGSAEPIYLVANPRHDGDQVGCIRRVHFRNIRCRGECGGVIAGWPGAHIEDVSMDGVHFHVENTSKWPGGRRDRRPAHSQEHGGLEWGDTPGLRIEHAQDIRLRDVGVSWGADTQDWFGAALEVHDVSNLDSTGFRGAAGRPGIADRIER